MAHALETSQPIVIVTIQTFPHVLDAIENSASLKERNYAIIADEAHSSQSGRTAGKLKAVLTHEVSDEDAELSPDDEVTALVASRQAASNLSYYAFTATPKGSGKPRNKEEVALSELITRLNEIFITDGLSDQDMLNYFKVICDKVEENEKVMNQLKHNSAEQALRGDFGRVVDDAVMDSSDAQQNQMMQYLNNVALAAEFQRRVLIELLERMKSNV